MACAHDGAIAGRSGDPVPPQPSLADPDRVMQADRVRDTALVVLRRNDPNLMSELAGDPLEDFETWRFDPIVIGYENAIQHHEHEFNEWYNTEHIPALGAVPGVLCARRYHGTGGTQRYVALYHLTAPEVTRSAEWKKAADTPWTQKMRPHFRDMLRIECRRYTRAL
jgi:hypothetical protein